MNKRLSIYLYTFHGLGQLVELGDAPLLFLLDHRLRGGGGRRRGGVVPPVRDDDAVGRGARRRPGVVSFWRKFVRSTFIDVIRFLWAAVLCA